jgi:hypothetical protein
MGLLFALFCIFGLIIAAIETRKRKKKDATFFFFFFRFKNLKLNFKKLIF